MTKKNTPSSQSREVLEEMSTSILSVFADFKMPMKLVDAVDGFKQYHFYLQPEKRVRMKSIHTFADDLRYELGVDKIDIEAPIPDKKLIGITIPKKPPYTTLTWESALADIDPTDSPLSVPVGIDEFGELHKLDLAKAPHTLIGGTTGSGKTELQHAIINYLLERHGPNMLRFIMVDPKRVDLAQYNDLPHLLTPVVHDSKKVTRALLWATKEMERRYDVLHTQQQMNISAYHKNISQPQRDQWEQQRSQPDTKTDLPEAMPYIVIVIDELNDVMQAYPEEMERLCIRLAQMSRAVGIHLILSTQRPSANVITGALKANIPTRIAMAVASQVDSRTILDVAGAEKLVGEGDMLYLASDAARPTRLQGFHIAPDSITQRVKRIIQEDRAGERDTLDLSGVGSGSSAFFNLGDDDIEDDLYEDARAAVIEAGKASTSYLQRYLRVGYSRAARLLDLLEENGVIGPQIGSKPREVQKQSDQ